MTTPVSPSAGTTHALIAATDLDIGVVVALDDGQLLAPVVRRADTKDIAALAAEIATLADRGQLDMTDISGGVFSITNLGGYPRDASTLLVHQPQTAMLGMGRARKVPTVIDDRIEIRVQIVLSLTVDHQVIDGVPAAAFLSDLGDCSPIL